MTYKGEYKAKEDIMRIVEKILCGIGGFIALILLFILLCHFNPELAKRLGNDTDNKNDTSVGELVQESGGQPADEAVKETAGISSISDDTQENSVSENKIPEPVVIPANTSETGIVPVSTDTDKYEVPDDSDIHIPAKVDGLFGYIPVKENGTEITKDSADRLIKELGTGETGDGLTFDETMYPYYQMLDETGQALYRQIYANAEALNEKFAPVESVTGKQLKNSFTAVVNDHPELFWVETSYQYRYGPDGNVAEIDLIFNSVSGKLDTAKPEFENAAASIAKTTYGKYTDYEKEVQVHDELISKVVYDKNAPLNQSAYSALVSERTVCAGYARAFQYIMQQLGIPCYYVTGYAGENHAWNIVQLEDGYYNVDSTWDDTDPNTHDYFNCSDDDYKKDHARRDLSIYLPPCNGEKYRDLITDSKDEESTVSPDNIISVGYVVPTTETDKKPIISSGTAAVNTPTNAGSSTAVGTTNTGNNTTSAGTTSGNNTNSTTTTSNSDTTRNSTNSSTASSNTVPTQVTVTTVRNTGNNDSILDDIDKYYRNCFDAMMKTDDTTVTFINQIKDEKLWKKIEKAYEKGKHAEGYLNRVLAEKHLSSCTIDVSAQAQSDGTYLITHTAKLQ